MNTHLSSSTGPKITVIGTTLRVSNTHWDDRSIHHTVQNKTKTNTNPVPLVNHNSSNALGLLVVPRIDENDWERLVLWICSNSTKRSKPRTSVGNQVAHPRSFRNPGQERTTEPNQNGLDDESRRTMAEEK